MDVTVSQRDVEMVQMRFTHSVAAMLKGRVTLGAGCKRYSLSCSGFRYVTA